MAAVPARSSRRRVCARLDAAPGLDPNRRAGGGLGIIASFVLAAISRAVGETMIVLIAAGGLAQITFDPRDQAQTMTAFVGATGIGDVPTVRSSTRPSSRSASRSS